MNDVGVLLVHGLGGTEYDLGSMHKRLKNAGLATHALTLPGHGSSPEDLVGVRAEAWLEAVCEKYREVQAQHETLHLLGMCMGSLLVIEAAKRVHHRRGRLVVLAPPLFLDGWATPWYRGARGLFYRIPGLPQRMKVREEEPFGIKNEQLREIVKAKFERGEKFHYAWVPLACIRELDRLREMVMDGLDEIACETLVAHARRDELTSLRSATYLVEHIGAGRRAGLARMLVLENSYHMVCVDNDKEIVAKHVLEFLGADGQGTTGMGSGEPGMSEQEIRSLTNLAANDLIAGNIAGLFSRGIRDFTWFQPGGNRLSGTFRGRSGLEQWQKLNAGLDALSFTALGEPSINAGVALVPATLIAGASLASEGAIALSMRKGKLLEARWFPDEIEAEDDHFGSPPAENTDTLLEARFLAAAESLRSLARAPDPLLLLTLYGLYKQARLGDVSGERPGILDPEGRAKFDAWSMHRGMSLPDAMSNYISHVEAFRGSPGLRQ